MLKANTSKIAAGALTGADVLVKTVVAVLLTLFLTLFFLIDGPGIWRWCVRLAPRHARAAVDGAGRAAWLSLHEYVRVQIVVALIDGVAVGIDRRDPSRAVRDPHRRGRLPRRVHPDCRLGHHRH